MVKVLHLRFVSLSFLSCKKTETHTTVILTVKQLETFVVPVIDSYEPGLLLAINRRAEIHEGRKAHPVHEGRKAHPVHEGRKDHPVHKGRKAQSRAERRRRHEMAATKAATGQLILSGPSTWHDWMDSIKKMAMTNRVWHLVDPNGPESQKPRTEPEMPDVSRIRPDARLETLTADEARNFNNMQKRHDMEKAAYIAEANGLSNVQQLLLTTIERRYHMYLRKAETVREMIQALKSRIAPTDSSRKTEAQLGYQRVLKAASLRSTNWEKWLETWEL